MRPHDDHVIEFYHRDHGTEFRIRFDDTRALEEAAAFLDRLLYVSVSTAGRQRREDQATRYAVDEAQYRAFRAFMKERGARS